MGKKVIVMSIQPAYANLIRQGIKDIELRTMIPNDNVLKQMVDSGTNDCDAYLYESKSNHGLGKVFGKFKFNKVIKIEKPTDVITNDICKRACVDERYIAEATKGFNKPIYALLLKDYKDITPKDLNEFGIEKAPQSWCYGTLNEELSISDLSNTILKILPECEIEKIYFDDGLLLQIWSHGTYKINGTIVDIMAITFEDGYIKKIDHHLQVENFKWLFDYWIKKTRFKYEKA